MWRFLQRRRDDQAGCAGTDVRREADEMFELFAPLRAIEPDHAARAEGRASLQAALVSARATQRRPRLASVRAFSIAAAGLAGSSVLVASAATGTDPLRLVMDVSDWPVSAWSRSSVELFQDSVTVVTYDVTTGLVEAMNDEGELRRLLLSTVEGDTASVAGPLERDTKIEVTFEAPDDASQPARVTSVEIVSTPPPDLAREPEPTVATPTTDEARPTRAPEPTLIASNTDAVDDGAPAATRTVEPTQPPKTDDRDSPSVATFEPAPTEPKNTDTGALGPQPTRTPTPTATPEPTETPSATPTPDGGVKNVDGTAVNLDGTVDGDELKLDGVSTAED